MPGMAALAMGAAPVVGGALLGAAVGQLRGPDLREGIENQTWKFSSRCLKWRRPGGRRCGAALTTASMN